MIGLKLLALPLRAAAHNIAVSQFLSVQCAGDGSSAHRRRNAL
jgi:hypothetical protein